MVEFYNLDVIIFQKVNFKKATVANFAIIQIESDTT